MKSNHPRTRIFVTTLSLLFTLSTLAQGPLTSKALLALESAGNLQISPDGTEVLYSVSIPRGPNEEPGGSHTTYFRMTRENKISTPLFGKDIKGSSPQFSPDGKLIGFLHAAEGESKQVWYMNMEGREISRLTDASGGVSLFRWQPGKKGIAYLSKKQVTEKEQELKARGYGFIFYEENLKNHELFLAQYDENWKQTEVKKLTDGIQTWDFEFAPNGSMIAATISPKNLIDQKYMLRRIFMVNPETGERTQISNNEGKLGNYQFSPDGTHMAYCAALNLNDHAVSQAFVADIASGEVKNLTPDNFRGHISWVSWKDNKELLYFSGEGVYPKLSSVPIKGGKRKILLDASKSGIIFSTPKFDKSISQFVFIGSTPGDMANLYSWNGKGKLQKLTNLNPGLEHLSLGKQEVIRFNARDGLEIEGIVIHPVGYESGQKYPLVVYVHGGPESHHSNGWLSRYSTPGQVMAGKGYLVLYLNYRASTGYGVPFAMEGFADPAGKEFDDIADGIDWMVQSKGADRERVGMAGGSYGGYASGWFATYYTKYVKAVCMFVGISNVISKRGTTDIALEELYVHSGKPLEEMWQFDLERSPIYWAHQSKTATLIYGGADDPRVHPSQSMELYRRMKVNKHPAVRLVQYPGEGHGNRKQVGRIDVLYRQMEWLDWYVRDLKPLDGPMPSMDISDLYGLDW